MSLLFLALMTRQVLSYVAGKLEADRVNTAAIFANADKVFGDKKGATKLRCVCKQWGCLFSAGVLRRESPKSFCAFNSAGVRNSGGQLSLGTCRH